jgi:hypothetical protein
MEIKDMSDEQLLNDLMYWFRIGRNEDGLKDKERKYFRSVCDEISRRDILNPANLFKDK